MTEPPPGWSLSGMDVHRGHARLWFDSDRAGSGAVVMTLRNDCDTTAAVEVPSDEAGARRYEKVDAVVGRYRGTRSYVFDGGCVTYDFNAQRDGWTALGNEASVALSFVTRDRVAEIYRATTGGLSGP